MSNHPRHQNVAAYWANMPYFAERNSGWKGSFLPKHWKRTITPADEVQALSEVLKAREEEEL